MFQKVFEYAGPHKKGLYTATAVVLVSVLMGVIPFILAYQVIAPLVMGKTIDAAFIGFSIAVPGFASHFLRLGTEYLTQGSL